MTSISRYAMSVITLLTIVSALACSATSSPAAPPTQRQSLPIATLGHAVTEAPSSTSANATAPAATSTPLNSLPTPPTITPIPAPKDIQQIWMVDESHGWASDGLSRLYRTDDAGAGWYLVSVPVAPRFGAFLDSAHAWLADSASSTLWRTTDGGLTWTHLMNIGLPTTGGEPFYKFTSADDGVVELSVFGQGNMYDRLFETHDGGASFQPIPVIGPTTETGLAERVIQYCRLCGNALYYDSSRAILVEGNLQQPPGSVNVKQSTDLGQHWSESVLPLPTGYQDALVVALPLTFTEDGHGYLPIRLLKYNATGKAYDAVSIYTSADGGSTWNLSPTVLSDTEPFMLNFHAADAEVPCGGKLCVSHDYTQTWQTLTPNVDFSYADTHYVLQMTFATPLTGWIILWENGASSLYRTTDGGMTWAVLNP